MPHLGEPRLDRRGHRAEGLGDIGDAPIDQLRDRRARDRQQARNSTSRPCRSGGHRARAADRSPVEPAEILGAGAGDPPLLQRPPLLVARRDVEEADRIGAEQPFVGGGDQIIGIDRGEVERQRAGRLGGVEDQGRRRPSGSAAPTASRSIRPCRRPSGRAARRPKRCRRRSHRARPRSSRPPSGRATVTSRASSRATRARQA